MRGGMGEADTLPAAGDTQLGSSAAEKMKYTALCVQWQVNPCGDVPLASRIRSRSYAAPAQRSTAVTAVTPPASAAQYLGVKKAGGGKLRVPKVRRLPLCISRVRTTHKCLALCEGLAHPRPLIFACANCATYAHSTSARSIGFCVIWVCISSSSSSGVQRRYRSR
jgi:hypothetical protein